MKTNQLKIKNEVIVMIKFIKIKKLIFNKKN